MQTSFASQIPADGLILTTHQRLAHWLTQTYQKEQITSGKQAWNDIPIYPIAHWLTLCWQEAIEYGLLPPRYLLTDHQELTLWERIIRHSKYGNTLLHTLNTAQQAREAWRLCRQWHIDIQSPLFNHLPDTQAWQIWAFEFAHLCKQHGFIDSASLGVHLTPIIQKLSLPSQICLIGFVEIPPYLKRLLEQIEQLGCKSSQWQPNLAQQPSHRMVFSSTAQEIEHMTAWTYHLVKEQISHSIGCIVPNLATHRHKLIHSFTRIFGSSNFFNIAGGIPLSEYPLVAIALTCLNLGKEVIDYKDLDRLLHSPYLAGGTTEAYSRARLVLRLNQIGIEEIPIGLLLKEAVLCPHWRTIFKEYLKYSQHDVNQLPSQWANSFNKQLQALGWSGDRTLDSQEYQLQQAWQSLLQEYARLDTILHTIPRHIALMHLQRLANQHLFQAASETGPIQILNISDALGMQFDYCWIMNMDDETWPSSPNPNPFIPLSLQRKHAIPHANAERELTYCLNAFSQLERCAKQVIFSYAEFQEERLLLPSPCLKACEIITWDVLAITDIPPIYRLPDNYSLECIEDYYGPSLDTTNLTKGGSAIFRLQAACPMRAFTQLRLKAYAIQPPSLGLAAYERGSLIHTALEKIWLEIKDHQTLCQYNDTQLLQVVDQSVQYAIGKLLARKSYLAKSRLLQLEKKHLIKLLIAWLEHEKRRSPFQVVATELKQQVMVSDIPLQIQIDRIDQLTDQSLLLIDYKTGYSDIQGWFGERPDEPQLPLYCITSPQPIQGLAYAQIKQSSMQIKGIGSSPALAVDSFEQVIDWDYQIQVWQNTLKGIADEFKKGYAKRDPKEPPNTCRYCELPAFCRIYEQTSA